MKKIFTLFTVSLLCFGAMAQGVWTPKANFAGPGGRGAPVAFSIGTKGYLGLGTTLPGPTNYNDLWEWDQSTNAWTQKANFPGTARGSAVGFAIGTKGYVGTGNSTSPNQYYQDFYEYDPSTNIWTQKANVPGAARTAAVGFSIGTKGYLGTGVQAPSTYSQDFYEYDPATNIWTLKANFPGAGRWHATAFSIGTKGYIGTGLSSSTQFQDFYEYDPSTDSWLQRADFGGGLRQGCASFSIGNKGYIGTGKLGPYFDDFWEWDPSTNVWTQMANYGAGQRQVARGFSIGTKGYFACGNDASNVSQITFWEWGSCSVAPNQPGTITGPTTICNGSTNNYSITAVTGATYYTWVLPGGWTGTSTTTSISATASATSGTISITANNACGSSSAQTLAVTVNTVSASTSTTFTTCGTCCDGTATTVPSGGSAPYTYVWSPSGGTAATASGLCNGTYTVCITDAIGCTTCSTVSVSFNVGIYELNENNISIYPNPFNDLVNIKCDNLNGSAVAEIFNVLGERIYSQQIANAKTEIDLSKIESGIYFIKITTGEGSVTKKIIKQ